MLTVGQELSSDTSTYCSVLDKISVMRLISLNIWEGKLSRELKNFLLTKGQETDIFCFQEVTRIDHDKTNRMVLADIQRVLSDFRGYFEDYVAPGEYNKEGLAIFVKNNITVSKEGEVFIYNPPNVTLNNSGERTLWRNMAYIQFSCNGKKFLIANLHGLFNGPNKQDNPDRIKQAQRVRAFFDRFQGAKILCGDFNLLPNSESLKIMGVGMRDLVKEFKVTSTRSRLFPYENKFADYLLVSSEVTVKQFKVFDETISDHLPMYLEFE